jgi:hypothetical protein
MSAFVLDLPDDLLRRIEATASVRGESLGAYVLRVLDEAAVSSSRAELIAIADRVRESSRGRPQTDSTEIIRKFRDANWGYVPDDEL